MLQSWRAVATQVGYLVNQRPSASIRVHRCEYQKYSPATCMDGAVQLILLRSGFNGGKSMLQVAPVLEVESRTPAP